MADTNTASNDLAAREVDFVTQFNNVWQELGEVLGITRPIRKQPGTQLVAVRADVTLAESVGAGSTTLTQMTSSKTSARPCKRARLTRMGSYGMQATFV